MKKYGDLTVYNYNLQAVEWSRREIKRWYKANRYFAFQPQPNFAKEVTNFEIQSKAAERRCAQWELVHRYTSDPKKQHLNLPVQAANAEAAMHNYMNRPRGERQANCGTITYNALEPGMLFEVRNVSAKEKKVIKEILNDARLAQKTRLAKKNRR